MFCIFHSWDDVTHHISRFAEYTQLKECSNCGKLSVEFDDDMLDSLSKVDLHAEAGAVVTMADYAKPSVKNYPNEYEVEVAWELMKYL